MIEGISRDEWEAWLQSNCTQALLLSLEGDIAGIVALWANGAYADQDNVEGTAQLNAKALGMMEAISGVSEHIRTMLDTEQTEDAVYGY